jgi:cobalamin biosynthesis Mg chelatase CobN
VTVSIIILAQGWGDFIQWLEGHQATAEIVLAAAALALTGALVWATCTYVKQTRQMAQEMRDQTMNAVRPFLVANHKVTGNVGEAPTVEVEPANIGFGPALNVQCVFNDPTFAYYEEWWSVIAPGQTRPGIRLRRSAGEDRKPEQKGETSRLDVEAAISIKYADVHGRLFETLIILRQDHIGWNEIRADVRLIDTVDRRARPTASWVELQVRDSQEDVRLDP